MGNAGHRVLQDFQKQSSSGSKRLPRGSLVIERLFGLKTSSVPPTLGDRTINYIVSDPDGDADGVVNVQGATIFFVHRFSRVAGAPFERVKLELYHVSCVR